MLLLLIWQFSSTVVIISVISNLLKKCRRNDLRGFINGSYPVQHADENRMGGFNWADTWERCSTSTNTTSHQGRISDQVSRAGSLHTTCVLTFTMQKWARDSCLCCITGVEGKCMSKRSLCICNGIPLCSATAFVDKDHTSQVRLWGLGQRPFDLGGFA